MNFIIIIFHLFFFWLGAIVGSFLNVVALRLKTGKSIVFSRSACFHCDNQLKWYELVPVFSFIFLGGRCRNCKSSISPQYLVVEIITGLIFVALVNIYYLDFYNLVFYLIIFSILIIITIYDLRHMIIPDSLSYTFSILALLKLILDHGATLLSGPGLWWLLAGPILALPFALIWFFSRGKWMGLGDAKLVLGIGWILGMTAGVSAIVFAFWVGAVVSIILMLTNRGTKHNLSMKSEVPFAPFLILGMAIVFFLHFDLFGLLLSGWY